jgi:hypothetical protein
MRSSRLVLLCLALAACGSTDRQFVTDARPSTAGQVKQVGVGDTVLDLKITEPLPNAFGKADVFGRTRAAGRVIVRYLGERGEMAFFSRQDVTIQSSDTIMSRTGMYVPNVQQTAMAGSVGTIPVSATATTVGTGTYTRLRPLRTWCSATGKWSFRRRSAGSFW